MKDVLIAITGVELDFEVVRKMAGLIAQRENAETDCVAWADARQNRYSPSHVECEINGKPGWEVYGENHGGGLKISFNQGEYVFIYS
jgi:hypothetical protein